MSYDLGEGFSGMRIRGAKLEQKRSGSGAEPFTKLKAICGIRIYSREAVKILQQETRQQKPSKPHHEIKSYLTHNISLPLPPGIFSKTEALPHIKY
jgi:hypothetical protein